MSLKPARSISDQIALLKKRGMVIDNLPLAEAFLTDHHYYRLNIYFHKLMDAPDHFPKGITFSDIIAISGNDSWLRNRILTILEPIEIKTRTQIAHYLGMTYGADAFYQSNLYKKRFIWQTIQDNFQNEINRNRSDPVIKHHMKRYSGQFPIWAIVEYLTFNTLSKYYQNLQEKDKKQIARNGFHLNDYLLGQWLHVISVLRNICAHYGYLYRRTNPLRPIMAHSFGWDRSNNHHLFAVFLVMKRLSNESTWFNFIQSIREKEETTLSFQLQDYGFPENWKAYLT